MSSPVNAPEQFDEKSGGRDRSTIEFPYADLESAFEVVRGVHNAGGTSCEADHLAAQLGLEVKGGGFRLKVNAARMFGLITSERGGYISLSDLGRQAIDPQYERAARVGAFLSVALFQKVFEEFKGRPLPPRAALEKTLVKFGVAEKVADRARQVLERSARQAGFFDVAADRLVKPRVDEAMGVVAEKEEQASGGSEKSRPSGAGVGELHPFIEGLLKTLPPPETNWSIAGRVKWLQAASHVFDLIYLAEEQNDEKGPAYIEISKKSL